MIKSRKQFWYEFANEPVKVAEVPEADKQSDGMSSKVDADLLNRIIGLINGARPILVDGKITFKGLLENIFSIRFKHERVSRRWAGFNCIFNPKVHEYTTLVSSVVGMIVPDTAVAKSFEFVRNVMLIDTLTGMVSEKIQPGHRYANIADWVKIMNDHKNVTCPIDLNEYGCQSSFYMDMVGMLIVFLGMTPIGTKITLHSVNGTYEAELVYRSADVLYRDGYYEFVDDTSNRVDMILKLGDLDEYLLFGVNGSILGKRKYVVDPAYSGKALWIGRDDVRFELPAERIPYSVIDPNTYALFLCNETLCIVQKKDSSWTDPVPDSELPYTKANVNCITEILRSIEQGLSRSYALVGVPGTGKTRLMTEVRNRCADSLVVDITNIGLSNDEFNGYNKFTEIIATAPHQHMLILMDDMDKTDDIDKVSKTLILMFNQMHSIRPGGEGKLNFTFIATINNPTLLGNAIIKRSKRFDEVIKMDLPTMKILGKQLDMIKNVDKDKTNYKSIFLLPAYVYMRIHGITLADIGNIYDMLHIKTKGERKKYGVFSLLKAAKTIVKNKKNAKKEYLL